MTPVGMDCAAALPTDTAAVLIDRGGPGFEAWDSVTVPNEDGAYRAVQHLIAHGHREIGFLGSSFEFETVVARVNGYRRALAAADVVVNETWVDAAWGTSAAEAAAARMLALDETPTAIFAATPMAGQGTISAMRAAGGTDIALLVFGDFPMADLLTPAITVIDQDPSGQAEVAMDRLFARIAGDDRPP